MKNMGKIIILTAHAEIQHARKLTPTQLFVKMEYKFLCANAINVKAAFTIVLHVELLEIFAKVGKMKIGMEEKSIA